MFSERIVVPTRSELREATRLRVLDSARRLFEARGFNATTVRAIAADAGKDDVIVAVSHGAATNLGATHLLGMDPQQWFGLRGMSNCCYALMRTNKRPPSWSVVKWNAGPSVDPSPLGRILG